MADPVGYKLSEPTLRRLQRGLTRLETQPYDTTGDEAPRSTSGTSIAWQRGTNASGSTIPAYSCVAVGAVSATADGYLAALTQPAGSTTAQYGLTGSNDCPGYGPSGPSLCSFHLEAGWAAYDSSATPMPGDTWGPKSGQFTLTKGQPGFTVVAVVDAGRNLMLVIPQSSVKLVRFELSTDIVFGTLPTGNNAYICRYTPGSWAKDTSSPIIVYDWEAITGNFSAWTGRGPVGGQTGYQGWAVQMPDSNRYEIIWMERIARYIKFKLTSALTTISGVTSFTSASASVVDSSDGRNPDPASAGITVYSMLNNEGTGVFTGPSGGVGYAFWDDDTSPPGSSYGFYRIVQLEDFAAHIDFTTTALGTGAAPNVFSGCNVIQACNGRAPIGGLSATVDVYDELNGSSFKKTFIGAYGKAYWNRNNHRYEVDLVDGQCLLADATLSANLATTDTTGTVTLVGALTPWPFSQLPPTVTSITVQNPLKLAGLSGVKVIVAWDQSVGLGTGGWTLLAVQSLYPFLAQLSSDCPALSGTTPGSQTATIWAFNGTTLSSTGTTITVYNSSKTVVKRLLSDNSTVKFIQCKNIGGYPFIDVDDCS